MENADYVIDSICRQLRHLDLNPHVPNVLAAMLSYLGVTTKILPLLEEPVCVGSQCIQIVHIFYAYWRLSIQFNSCG